MSDEEFQDKYGKGEKSNENLRMEIYPGLKNP